MICTKVGGVNSSNLQVKHILTKGYYFMMCNCVRACVCVEKKNNTEVPNEERRFRVPVSNVQFSELQRSCVRCPIGYWIIP